MLTNEDKEMIKEAHSQMVSNRTTTATIITKGSVTDTYTLETTEITLTGTYQGIFGITNRLNNNYSDGVKINTDKYFFKMLTDDVNFDKDIAKYISISGIIYEITCYYFDSLYSNSETITFFMKRSND